MAAANGWLWLKIQLASPSGGGQAEEEENASTAAENEMLSAI